MDKFVPIIYLIGVLILILPSFLSSNNKWKTIVTKFCSMVWGNFIFNFYLLFVQIF